MPIFRAKIVIIVATVFVVVIGGFALHEHDMAVAHRKAKALALALDRAAYARWTSGTVPKPSGQGYGQFSDP
jgi:hypothetical protein